MNTSGVNPTHSQRFSHSPPVTGRGSAQASPAGVLCAAYREALENLASPLCRNLLVDSCMEHRLCTDEGGFLESHEVSQVQQQSNTVQKMEKILSILRTKDDQAFRGFIEWLCDSDSSRSWGQALAEQAGLSGAAVSGHSSEHLGQEALRRRALGEVPVIQVPPGPNRFGAQVAEGSGPSPADPAVRREGVCKTICQGVIESCQEVIESTCIATGWVCGAVCGSLPGLCLASLSLKVLNAAPEYHEECNVDGEDYHAGEGIAYVGFTGLLASGTLAIVLARGGATMGRAVGERVGRGISGLLGRPAVARFNPAFSGLNERDMVALEHRQYPRQLEPRRDDEAPTCPRLLN